MDFHQQQEEGVGGPASSADKAKKNIPQDISVEEAPATAPLLHPLPPPPPSAVKNNNGNDINPSRERKEELEVDEGHNKPKPLLPSPPMLPQVTTTTSPPDGPNNDPPTINTAATPLLQQNQEVPLPSAAPAAQLPPKRPSPQRAQSTSSVVSQSRPSQQQPQQRSATSSAARNVLKKAGRPLRSVGRRLRFHGNSQNSNSSSQNYQSLTSIDGGEGEGAATARGEEEDSSPSRGLLHQEQQGNPTPGSNNPLESLNQHFSPLIRRLSNNPKDRKKRDVVDDPETAVPRAGPSPAAIGSPPFAGGRRRRGRAEQDYYYDEVTSASSAMWGIVSKLETGLRSIAMLLGAYLIGAYWHDPTPVWYAGKAFEYTAVAWITCGTILILVRCYAVSAPAQPPPPTSSSRTTRSIRAGYGSIPTEEGEDAWVVDEEEGAAGGTQPSPRRSIAASSNEGTVEHGEPRQLSKSHQRDNNMYYDAQEEQQQPNHRNNHHHRQLDNQREGESGAENYESLYTSPTASSTTTQPAVVAQEVDSDSDEEDGNDDEEAQEADSSASSSLFVIDSANGQRIVPYKTVSQPYKLETEYFTGQMVIFVRTPHVDNADDFDDDPTDHPGSNNNKNDGSGQELVRSYLRDKQRRFEFQFQVKLKKLPTGMVYFGCELVETVKLGMIQRAFVGAAMAFVKTTNNNFSYSLTAAQADPTDSHADNAATNGTGNPPPSLERPHMAFPIEEGMNRVVATPPGHDPPMLGKEIIEDEASLKSRKKGAQIEWNLEDTYTLSLWSAYVDFLDWRCMNLPGIRPFDLMNVISNQHINLTLYEVTPEKERKDICTIELSNASKSRPGPAAVCWMQKHHAIVESRGRPIIRREPSTALASVSSSNDDISQSALIVPEDDDDQMELDSESDFEEEEKIAELGEGIYIKSGDCITLREFVSSLSQDGGGGGSDSCSYVTYGGGFAVLQEHRPATVVIEKVGGGGRSRSSSSSSKLIKSGDTVMFKLVTNKETRYLSIHRGWWLKWVLSSPSNNGFFTIFTHETECTDHGSASENQSPSTETQASYLTFGGSFWLRHKRWRKYQVGAAADVSATYGGRILGLYSQKTNCEEDFDHPDREESDQNVGGGGEKSRSDWLRPLQLRAYEAPDNVMPMKSSSEDVATEEVVVDAQLVFSKEHLRVDVPAYLEMMNKKDRHPQLVYVIRVSSQNGLLSPDGDGNDSFIRLRTGRQISHITRVGRNWRNSVSTQTPRRKASMDTTISTLERPKARRLQSEPVIDSPPRMRASSENEIDNISVHDAPDENSYDSPLKDDDELSSDGVAWSDSGYDLDASQFAHDPLASNRPKKRLIRKIASSVKEKTKSTGKHGVKVGKKVVKQGVKVGKGTVSASVKVGKGTVKVGKAIIKPRPKNPPSKEPKASTAPRRSRKRIEKDLHAAVSRSMRRMDKEDQSSTIESPPVLAGELSAPEQSVRTVSNMLNKMSSLPASAAMSNRFSNLLASEISPLSEQDAGFLSGGAIQLGVVVPGSSAVEATKGRLLHDSLVARCLWESHWREEWFGLYENVLSFYAPLTDYPCLELSLMDIQSVRNLEAGGLNPLPGYPILVLETFWMCHYIAFGGAERRDAFRDELNKALARIENKRNSEETSLWQARFWQGFQTSLNSSVSSGLKGKWADVTPDAKMKARLVLNNRRMVFDVPDEPDDPEALAEQLLETSLSFSHLHHLKEHPEDLVKFLDATSQLRRLPLQSLDLSSPSAFCIFVNLYHCLLQHAMLLTVNGPLNKHSYGHFMQTSCYEIGGDVFSLAELNCCVIRGNMSRPLAAKAPAIDVPKKSESYRFYALGYITPKVNFLLNTGDTACPREVPVLTPSQLETHINIQTAEFLRQNIMVDFNKRIMFLPRICEAYRSDFASDAIGAANMCLRYCFSFLDDDYASAIRDLLDETPAAAAIKYRKSEDQYHSTLQLRDYASSEGCEIPSAQSSRYDDDGDGSNLQSLSADELAPSNSEGFEAPTEL